MPRMKAAHLLTFTLLTSTVGAMSWRTVGKRGQNVSVHAGHAVPSLSHKTICGDGSAICNLPAPDLHSQALVERFARQLVSLLVSPDAPGTGGSTGSPQWEAWATKRCVFQSQDCGSRKSGNALANVELPVQLRFEVRDNQAWLKSKLHGKSVVPLSSLYYNDMAAQFLQPLGLNHLFTGRLPPGSIIVKPVWFITDAQAKPLAYATFETLDSERDWSLERPSSLELPIGTRGYSFQPISLDLKNAMPCAPAGKPVTQIAWTSPKCFHYYNLQQGSFGPNHEPSDDFLRPLCVIRCTAMLVGVNMMVRTETDGDWVWITLWWTGHDNGEQAASKTAPWNNYILAATASARSVPINKKPNILFNPYLESVQTNGTSGNCQNCHSYAAVDAGGISKLKTGVDASHGAQNYPGSLLQDAATRTGSSDQAYFNGSTATDLVWSVANRKLPGAPKLPSASLK